MWVCGDLTHIITVPTSYNCQQSVTPRVINSTPVSVMSSVQATLVIHCDPGTTCYTVTDQVLQLVTSSRHKYLYQCTRKHSYLSTTINHCNTLQGGHKNTATSYHSPCSLTVDTLVTLQVCIQQLHDNKLLFSDTVHKKSHNTKLFFYHVKYSVYKL